MELRHITTIVIWMDRRPACLQRRVISREPNRWSLGSTGTGQVSEDNEAQKRRRREDEFEEAMLIFEACRRRAYDIADAIGLKEKTLAHFEQMVQDLKQNRR